MYDKKDKEYAGKVKKILKTLSSGFVIVEGAHDIAALNKLGLKSFAYSQVLSKQAVPAAECTVYLLTDSDKGGEEKKEKLLAVLREVNSGYKIDDVLGKHLMRLLNITSIEQICSPVEEILAKVN